MPSRPTRDLVLILLPWLALPVMAGLLLDARASLPARIAVHFGMDGRPDRWTSPAVFMATALGVLAVLLGVFTVRSLMARAAGRLYPLLVAQYILVVVVSVAMWQVVRFNRDGTKPSLTLLLLGVAVAVVASVVARRRLRG
jgi:uncharacterized membrane protein